MQRVPGASAAMAPSWDDNNRIEVIPPQPPAHTHARVHKEQRRLPPRPAALPGFQRTLHFCAPPQVVRNSALLPSKAKPLERALLERIPPQAQFVLIGEASHGTGACNHSQFEQRRIVQELSCAGLSWQGGSDAPAMQHLHAASDLRVCEASADGQLAPFLPCLMSAFGLQMTSTACALS